MRINADFSRRAAVHFDQSEWVPSPAAGVERKMLDRIGAEVARATTIVRFAPGSAFAAHTHDGGEEYLVLDGVFQDETGDFPEGFYVRNPPKSSHRPATEPGATILVKLHQFDPADRTEVRRATLGHDNETLFVDTHEEVRIETWSEGAAIERENPGGTEIFVLEGAFLEGSERFGKWDWLRLPPGQPLSLRVADGPVRVWMKSGHLSQMV
ncbi:cupin domain-containing protein [Ruegeria marina]|uniref:Anti-ECFsigma factor, ChrR n=1 Tax=Ruegeria marina TaxID=639004 RepID=A0A1G6QVE9_9RHOB|nr:cupin domain-containing protein [Ruegeria marina]SDC95696.1 anti-ECFsigma factor, ChrR [Ruegeria marina]